MRNTSSNGIVEMSITRQYGERSAPSTSAAASIGVANSTSTMPIAANARRSVRLDAAIETAATAAEIATPDSTIRPKRVRNQSPSPSGPAFSTE